MKIIQLLASPYDFRGGVWFYRVQMPSEALKARGHDVRFLTMSHKVTPEMLDLPDIVVFKGTYGCDPIPLLRKLKKIDTKVVYDVDDDYLTLNPGNPMQGASKKVKEQFIALCKEADVITTTTEVLKKRLKKFNKNVVIIPNALNFIRYKDRIGGNKRLRIGYTGASSHWEDIGLILNTVKKLQDKYDFDFFLQGMCGTPLVGEMYSYRYIDREGLEPEKKAYYTAALEMYDKLKDMKYVHIPFYPPELYPSILTNINLDIGLAPLKDNTFNQAKSSIKFYEYAITDTVCLASNVLPYSKECNYCANNTEKDWYNKLEKLIKNKKFREKLVDKQWEFVRKHANMEEIVKLWESTFRSL